MPNGWKLTARASQRLFRPALSCAPRGRAGQHQMGVWGIKPRADGRLPTGRV